MTLRIDFTNMMGDVVDGGISAADWTSAETAFRAAHAGLERRRDAGELGFLSLPTDDALHHQSLDFAAKTRGMFDDIIVLGIGGSALGPIALRTALLKPDWNSLDKMARVRQPCLHVLDNVDPNTIASLLDRIPLVIAAERVTRGGPVKRGTRSAARWARALACRVASGSTDPVSYFAMPMLGISWTG